MRAFILALLAALLAWPAAAAQPGAYAFIGVTVVPMDRERTIPAQTVVVRGGRIVAMGPASRVRVPGDAVRIDGRGRYLMPGLAEMHAHVPPNPGDAQWTEDVLFLYAANGITFARSMLGAPHHLELRARAERGEIVSPRIYTSGPSLNGNSVATPEDGRRMVAEQRQAGYDFLKIHPGLDRPRFDAIAETANRLRIPFGGHVPDEVGIERAFEVRQATVDHLDGYFPLLVADAAAAGAPGFFGFNLTDRVDEARIAEAVRRTRAAGTWNVPTESLLRHVLLPDPDNRLADRPEMRYVPRQMLASWVQARANLQAQPAYSPERARRFIEIRARLIKALSDGGAGLLLGSDAPQWFNVPGFALHRELEYLVDAGLTPFQALAGGTRDVARFIGEEQLFGTVAVGKRADLLLLDADPLADIANARRTAGVMLAGRWLPASRLQAGLAAIAARHAK
ncbi:MAG: amidohydrolase family protein [Allosphingosinicella sp.]|uniref:amidohydrolase family protein n=1 Tax=Allosphingosinicella sp. TaxID=2823234 RepID=UPI00395A098E